MAKSGSSSCALRNSSAASSYSKLCSSSTPCRNDFCACGAPEVGKSIWPRLESCENKIAGQHNREMTQQNFDLAFAAPDCILASALFIQIQVQVQDIIVR